MPRRLVSAPLLALFFLGVVRAEEEVNPYQKDGDSSDECYAWAADGQCQLNPGHMLTQCKYSCWEWYNYRSKAKKYEGAEIDRSMDCHGWANQGECGKNPTFMKDKCPQSCKDKGYDPPPPPPSEGKKKKRKKKKKKAGAAVKDEV